MDNVDRDTMIYRCNRQVVKIGSQQLNAYVEDYRPVKVTLPWGCRTVEQHRVGSGL